MLSTDLPNYWWPLHRFAWPDPTRNAIQVGFCRVRVGLTLGFVTHLNLAQIQV